MNIRTENLQVFSFVAMQVATFALAMPTSTENYVTTCISLGHRGELTQFFICGRGVQGQQRQTHCQSTHNIYVDTRLDTNCGIVSATLDGGAPVTLDCYYPTATSQMRRLLFSGVAAGQHEVVITISGNKNASSQGWYFYSISSNAL